MEQDTGHLKESKARTSYMSDAKYKLLSERISSTISEGLYKDKLPGLCKLASEYGTTHLTVAKALRLLEEKGLVTVNGTRGTYISRTAQRPRFRVIGLLGIKSTAEFKHVELDVIQDVAAKERYRVIALSDSRDLEELLEENTQFLVHFPADGFIFASARLTKNIASNLRGAGIPFISINYNPLLSASGVSWVDFDSEAGLKRILKELASRGHRRIAFASFNNLNCNFSQRLYNAYRSFMADMGSFDERLYYCPYTWDEYYGRHQKDMYSCFAQEIVGYAMALAPRPTAAIILGRDVAGIACSLFREAGLKIPGDMSIAGFFDDKCEISGVRNDRVRRASLAAEWIMGVLKNPKTPLLQTSVEMEWISGATIGSASTF